MKKRIWNIYTIVAISLLIRVLYLNHHDFWFDEAFSWFVASKNFKSIIIASVADNHPPLYYLILHLWMDVFGNSEVALRSLSLVFGLLSVPVFYKLAKTFNEKLSLFATLLFSISPLAVYYSAETRMYSLFLLLTLCSVYVWIKLLTKINKFRALAFIITLTASIYTHYLSFLLFIPFFYTAFRNFSYKFTNIYFAFFDRFSKKLQK
ncbi:glycosyltransferase family 39 protein [Candidatus Woesebacteria bacterium]|nr:glycosyltransferase family 39 protein [Candidatus Woesebacteria bacterium]